MMSPNSDQPRIHTARSLLAGRISALLLIASLVGLLGIPAAPSFAQQDGGAEAGAESASDAQADAAVVGPVPQPKRLVIGTGPVLGFSYPTAGVLCALMVARGEAETAGCSVRPGNGSEQNIRALLSGQIDLAIVQSDWLFFAQNGLSMFTNDPSGKRLKKLAKLHPLKLALVVAKDVEADSLADLQGKSINLGPIGSVQRVLSEIMMSGGRLNPSDFERVLALPAREQLQALCRQELDAFVIPAVHPSPIITTAINRCGARLLPVSGRRLGGIINDNPYLRAFEITKSEYSVLEKPISTFGLSHFLVATEEFEDEVLLSLLRTLDENFEDYTRAHLLLSLLQRDEVFLGADEANSHYAVRQFVESKEQ